MLWKQTIYMSDTSMNSYWLTRMSKSNFIHSSDYWIFIFGKVQPIDSVWVAKSERSAKLSLDFRVEVVLVASCVRLFVTPRIVACQGPLSIGRPRQHLVLSKILEWVAILFSRESSQPRDWTWHCWQILYPLSHQGGIRYPTALNTELNTVTLSHLNTVTVTWAWLMNGTPDWPLVNTSNHQLYSIISQTQWLQNHLHSTATSCSDLDICFAS